MSGKIVNGQRCTSCKALKGICRFKALRRAKDGRVIRDKICNWCRYMMKHEAANATGRD